MAIEIHRGSFRTVLLVGPFAVKVPEWHRASKGRRCNRWERETWRTWRPRFKWQNLCPIWFADPLGCVVIMARASAVTFDEIVAADRDDYPDINVEYKPDNWGRLRGRVVCFDYGLSDEASVQERRAYLGKMPPR
jgi:hypothetical protein